MKIRLPIAIAAAALLSPPAAAQGVQTLDSGTYTIHLGSRALGRETFAFESHRGDLLAVSSQVTQILPTPDGDVQIEKGTELAVNPLDFEIKNYLSRLKVGERTMVRGLVVDDTAFTAYRESATLGTGVGTRFRRPPGRLFVIETMPQVFVLYDAICRNLHGRSFDRRVLNVIALGDRDSVMEVVATDLGSETLRWGAKPVVARKLKLSDGLASVLLWIGPQGYMLRFEDPAGGLWVEREPPAVKPPARRSRSGG